MAKKPEKRQDPDTTGHSWDGIEEFNNPLPKWWLWILRTQNQSQFQPHHCQLFLQQRNQPSAPVAIQPLPFLDNPLSGHRTVHPTRHRGNPPRVPVEIQPSRFPDNRRFFLLVAHLRYHRRHQVRCQARIPVLCHHRCHRRHRVWCRAKVQVQILLRNRR